MEAYLEEFRLLLPVLGFAFLEEREESVGRKIYNLKLKGCSAQGFETKTEFMVLRGSIARVEELGAIPPIAHRRRQALISDGVLVLDKDAQGYRFSRNTPFTSTTAAAEVCYGGAAAGPQVWKDESGTTLKANREKATEA